MSFSINKGKGLNFGGSFALPEKPLRTMPKAPDPLAGSKSTGNLESDTEEQLTNIQKGFRQRAALEKERFEAATETSFYCCLVFDSGEQCDKFLKETGLDKGRSDLFVDGRFLAKKMGIELPPPVINLDRKFKVDRKLLDLTESNKNEKETE